MKLKEAKEITGGLSNPSKMPTPADQIDKELDKLFNPKLNKFLSLSFVCICASGWLLILLAIFSS